MPGMADPNERVSARRRFWSPPVPQSPDTVPCFRLSSARETVWTEAASGASSPHGTPLDGMYHEEHALPSFVHSRSRDQLRLPSMLLKGETPVIYFYTPRPMQVRVGVEGF